MLLCMIEIPVFARFHGNAAGYVSYFCAVLLLLLFPPFNNFPSSVGHIWWFSLGFEAVLLTRDKISLTPPAFSTL